MTTDTGTGSTESTASSFLADLGLEVISNKVNSVPLGERTLSDWADMIKIKTNFSSKSNQDKLSANKLKWVRITASTGCRNIPLDNSGNTRAHLRVEPTDTYEKVKARVDEVSSELKANLKGQVKSFVETEESTEYIKLFQGVVNLAVGTSVKVEESKTGK